MDVIKVIISAAALATIGTVVHADEPFDACIKRAGATVHMANCSSAWIRREDAALEKAYRSALAAAGGSRAATGIKMLVERRAWIAFKTQACGVHADRAKFGSLGAALTGPAYTARLTRARTAYLGGVADALVAAMSVD